jgi:hypothetical protein
MDEFGVGVSLYFKTLKTLFVVMLICALIEMVAIYANIQFNPDQYDINTESLLYPGVNPPPPTPLQLLGSVYGSSRNDLRLSKQCAADIAICIFLGIFSVFAYKAEEIAVQTSDKKMQTTRDYTVVVTNPPSNIKDPDLYYAFFKRFGDVVSVILYNLL